MRQGLCGFPTSPQRLNSGQQRSRTMIPKSICLTLRMAFSGALLAFSAAAFANEPTPELYRLGTALYKDNCAICHGENGEGNGSLASEFSPRPRNFTSGAFRFVSTPIGAAPSREDILRTIRKGIEGSYGRSMPAFSSFTSSEVLA